MIDALFRKHGWQICEHAPDTAPARGVAIALESGVEAIADLGLRRVWIESREALPEETLEHYLLDLVLPPLLSHDGRLVLHAGFLDAPAGGIGIIGPSGAGKSTLTARLMREGAGLLSDDVVLLCPEPDGPRAETLYPSLRLFPDSVEEVLPGHESRRPVAHYFDKQRLSVVEHVQSCPATVLFRLDAAEEAPKDGPVALEPLSQTEGCMALLANSFALDPGDRDEIRNRFALASRVAEALPVWSLRYPRQYDRLDEVVARVLDVAAAGSDIGSEP